MLGRHLIISIPMVVGFMLIAGAPVIYALPVYAAFLIFAAPMFSVLRLATDRSEGTVEFLSTLPVRATQLAFGRVLALLEGCLAAGFFAGVGILPLLGADSHTLRVVTIGAMVFLGVTLLLLASGTVLLWLNLRFRSQAFVVVFPLVLLGVPIVASRFSLPWRELWTELLMALESPLLILALVGVPSVLLGAGGFFLLERACDRLIRNPSLARPS
ncbi:MAG: hypothetical protein EA422_01020 [Gemmatimonadales bacterium]|nr:MAG: hypothetical protein EA422_01020 [Gemmatimonadales bacterium]